MSDVSGSERGSEDSVKNDQGPRIVIRYEDDGNKLVAVCEDRDGNRWYEIIMVDEEFMF